MTIRRSYVDSPSGQIHIAQAGEEGPIVLCLHQTPRSIDEFAEFIENAATFCRPIAIDLPGMGASSPDPLGATIETYASAVQTVMRSLGEPVAMLGHHTGGVVAIELARKCAPAELTHLVLSSTPWVGPDERAARARHPPIDTAAASDDGSFLLELWRQRAPYYPPDDGQLLTRFMRDALTATDPTEGHLAVSNYRMEDAFPLPRRPTLLIFHDDDPFSTAHELRMRAELPLARVVHLPGGRVPFEYSARPVAQHLKEFLGQHQEFRIRRATVDDAGAILTMQRAAYLSEGQRYGTFTLEPLIESVDAIRAAIDSALVLVAVDAGRIIGSIRAKRTPRRSWTMGRLAVAPDRQNTGVATHLVAEMERIMQLDGARRVHIFTGQRSHDNIDFYQRRGYVIDRHESSEPPLVWLQKDFRCD